MFSAVETEHPMLDYGLCGMDSGIDTVVKDAMFQRLLRAFKSDARCIIDVHITLNSNDVDAALSFNFKCLQPALKDSVPLPSLQFLSSRTQIILPRLELGCTTKVVRNEIKLYTKA